MLERQAARNRDAESYSTSSTASNQGKSENEFQSTQYNLIFKLPFIRQTIL